MGGSIGQLNATHDEASDASSGHAPTWLSMMDLDGSNIKAISMR